MATLNTDNLTEVGLFSVSPGGVTRCTVVASVAALAGVYTFARKTADAPWEVLSDSQADVDSGVGIVGIKYSVAGARLMTLASGVTATLDIRAGGYSDIRVMAVGSTNTSVAVCTKVGSVVDATTVTLPATTGRFFQGVTAQTAGLEQFNVTQIDTNPTAYFRKLMAKFEYALNPASAPGTLVDYHGVDAIAYGSSANLNSFTGIYCMEGKSQYSGSNTIFKLVGVYGIGANTSTGTTSNCVGVQAAVQNSSTGTITTGSGVLVSTGTNSSGTITTLIGVNVLDQLLGTTNYAIKTGRGKVSLGDTLEVKAGTASIAPVVMTAGTNLTTPVNGALEFDGTNLYFTVGGVRKTVTLI